MKKQQTPIQRGIYNTILASSTRSGKGVSRVVPIWMSLSEGDTIFDFMGKKVIRLKPVDVQPDCKSGKNLTFDVKETLTEDGSKFSEIVVGLKKGKKRRRSDGKTSNT